MKTAAPPLELIRDTSARSEKLTGTTAPLPYKMASALGEPTATDELVEGLVTRASLIALYGSSGCGKTHVAVHLVCCSASAQSFLGRRVQSAKAVYFASEAGRSAGNRFVAWQRESGVEHLPVAIVTCGLDLRNAMSVDADAIVATIRELGAEIAVIDTFNSAFGGGDENSSDDMGAMLGSLRRIIEATGVALIVVHHSGKVEGAGLRGHSSFHAAADAVLQVTNADGAITVELVKHRDGPIGAKLFARLRVVDLGVTDAWGNRLTSCVLDSTDVAVSVTPPPKLPKGARLVLRALTDAASDLAQALPATSGIPPGTRGITVEQWRSRYYVLDPLESDDHKGKAARIRRFKRGQLDLQEADLIGICNEWVWVQK
jgi:hypothetical protein